ncbi:bifunctional enoyl-CoA hydratase/phosphate acetyltransferase, partial [Azohydromonas lata]
MNALLETDYIENVTYDEISVGQTATLTRTISNEDIQAFAAVSGDTNPAHLNAEYAADTLFHGVIAHGMWGGSLISALLGTVFPGPGTIYLEQDLHFTKPVRIADTLTVTVKVAAKDDAKKRVELDCEVVNQKGACVLYGKARVLAPTTKVKVQRNKAPKIHLFDAQARLRALLALGADMPAAKCAVVHPCDPESLSGAIDAAQLGLIEAVLIGPEVRIRHVAKEAGIELGDVRIIDTPYSEAAAEKAAEMAAKGEVEMLMKGSLHTDELIHAVLSQKALRTGRRMSHVFRFDVPLYRKPILITDAALNIQPTLMEKKDIIQNAIDFARIAGIDQPKVAILAAVETVNP